MRRLAPMFLTTSILAFAAGTALAATDRATGSPTVPANTQNPQGMSYSDKSSSAPGTNAKMDSNSSSATYGNASATTSNSTSAMSGSATDSTTALANEDKRALANTNTAGKDRPAVAADASSADTMGTDTTKAKHKPKKAKKKVAKNDNISANPPTAPTSPAAAKSTTGSSPGGDGSSQ